MSDIDRLILATLAYADAAGMPLTAHQAWRKLLTVPHGGSVVAVPTLGETAIALDRMAAHGSVRCEDGWYAPAGTEGGFAARRTEQEKIQAQKFKRMRAKAFWLQAVPFARALAASGSLAAGTTGRDSDWDMFIIARRGRLYTVRVLLSLAAWLMRSLRTKRQRVAPDKFCFNHYVTDDGLNLRHRSLYVACQLASLIPVYDPDGMVPRLWDANRWAGDWLAHGLPETTQTVRRLMRRSGFLTLVRRVFEVVLSGPPGNALEAVLRRWQQRRIVREPATHARGGRVIADGRELEFHPHSAERAVLARYNAATAAMGMPAHEKDSGLTR